MKSRFTVKYRLPGNDVHMNFKPARCIFLAGIRRLHVSMHVCVSSFLAECRKIVLTGRACLYNGVVILVGARINAARHLRARNEVE